MAESRETRRSRIRWRPESCSPPCQIRTRKTRKSHDALGEHAHRGSPMTLWASTRIAVRALRVNKLRSALTMLGIVIGVGAVITMVAVGAGAQARVAEQIQSLGSNMIVVLSGSVTQGGVRLGSGSQLTITEDDAWAIQREIPLVEAAAPVVRGGAQIVYGNLNWGTNIQGVTPEYFTARDWQVASGRILTQEEVDGATKTALLGQTVSFNL